MDSGNVPLINAVVTEFLICLDEERTKVNWELLINLLVFGYPDGRKYNVQYSEEDALQKSHIHSYPCAD